MYSGPNLKLDDAALNTMLNDPKGEVGRYLRKIGLLILSGARAMVGVQSGALRRSLTMRQGLTGRYQYVSVGSNLSYAELHHEGSKPHDISGGVGRIMRFNVGGKVVYARKVEHPGTKPNKYLVEPMNRAVRR